MHPTFFDALNDQYNSSELAGITRDLIKVNYQGFLADCVIQVILPVLYFAIRYQQIASSSTRIEESIGVVSGLMSVPWQSREYTLKHKLRSFFNSLDTNKEFYSAIKNKISTL
jgi:hypothetical protein